MRQVYLMMIIFAAFLIALIAWSPAWFPDMGINESKKKAEREIEKNLSALNYTTIGNRQLLPVKTKKTVSDEKTPKAW